MAFFRIENIEEGLNGAKGFNGFLWIARACIRRPALHAKPQRSAQSCFKAVPERQCPLGKQTIFQFFVKVAAVFA